METKNERIGRLYIEAHKLGLSPVETSALLRASRTLHRWAEMECNGEVGRDDSGVAVRTLRDWAGDAAGCVRVPDRETAALKRIEAIIGRHPSLSYYHQTDPRGCALYVMRTSDIPEGRGIRDYYNRGVAFCI
jgi:hypothetical protein